MARNKRLGGMVVDGLVRDRPGICDAGVPCYARGSSATSAYFSGPGEVGVPDVEKATAAGGGLPGWRKQCALPAPATWTKGEALSYDLKMKPSP